MLPSLSASLELSATDVTLLPASASTFLSSRLKYWEYVLYPSRRGTMGVAHGERVNGSCGMLWLRACATSVAPYERLCIVELLFRLSRDGDRATVVVVLLRGFESQ